MIPLDQCKQGILYLLASRNLGIGVYSPEDASFTGIRTKFSARFLDREFHWDTGAPHGTAKPIRELGVCPVKRLDVTLGTVCGVCGEACEYALFPGGPRPVTFEDGASMTVPGEWVHLVRAECQKVFASSVPNTELFAWLDEQGKTQDFSTPDATS